MKTNTDDYNAWDGGEVELHAPILPKPPLPQPARPTSSNRKPRHHKEDRVSSSQDAPDSMEDVILAAAEVIKQKRKVDQFASTAGKSFGTVVKEDVLLASPAQDLPAGTTLQSSPVVAPQISITPKTPDIKSAFLSALASPIPESTDPMLVAQVEAARKVLGVSAVVGDQLATTQVPGQPPSFASSVDMKRAFTDAMDRPMSTAPVNQPWAAAEPSLNDDQQPKPKLFKKIHHSPTKLKQQAAENLVEHVEEVPVFASQSIVINPTGKTLDPLDGMPKVRVITKFAPKNVLHDDGWNGDAKSLTEPDQPIANVQNTKKEPFTIEETSGIKNT